MAQRLDPNSRDILEFRPDIDFVEPEVGPGEITPELPPGDTLEDVEERVAQVARVAKAVNTLATAMQARVDVRAQDMVINLDRVVDQQTIAAMKRHFPGEDPNKITYLQYQVCKTQEREKGRALAEQGMITRKELLEAGPIDREALKFNFGTEKARTGGLRPELEPRGVIFKAIDVQEFQNFLICILVNFIWKNFIKPIIASMLAGMLIAISAGLIPPHEALKIANNMIPSTICQLPEGFDIPSIIDSGVPVLGEKAEQFQKIAQAFEGIASSVEDAQKQADKEKETQ